MVAVAALSFEHWRRVFLVEEPWNEGELVLVLGALGALSALLALGSELADRSSLRRVFVAMALVAFGACLPKWLARAWYGRQVADARAWCEAWVPVLEAERARSGAAPARLPAAHDLAADVPYLIRVYEGRAQTYYAVTERGGPEFRVGRATYRGETWREWSG